MNQWEPLLGEIMHSFLNEKSDKQTERDNENTWVSRRQDGISSPKGAITSGFQSTFIHKHMLDAYQEEAAAMRHSLSSLIPQNSRTKTTKA